MDIKKQVAIRRASLGGKARGWEERKEALQRYHLSAHHCKNCGKLIEVGDRRVADVIKKKFCDSSCAATYNNKVRHTLTAVQAAT